MVLQKETRTGLTYGQLLATLMFIAVLFGVGLQANIRMSNIEINQATMIARIQELETGRINNAQNIEKIRLENNQGHDKIMDKLDETNRLIIDVLRR